LYQVANEPESSTTTMSINKLFSLVSIFQIPVSTFDLGFHGTGISGATALNVHLPTLLPTFIQRYF
jgi:hypothetical protein